MANKIHIKILEGGVENWNEWVRDEREKNNENRKIYWEKLRKDNENGIYHSAPLFLPFADFIGADLEDFDLSNSILNKADFKDANLKRADFQNAHLAEATFESADLRGANFKNADLTRSNLKNCKIDNTTIFEGVILYEANLEELLINRVSFKNSKITNTKLSYIKIKESNFDGVDFSNSEITNSEILNSNLKRTKFINTTITNCHLEDCNIYGASIWNLTTSNTLQKDLLITDSGEQHIYIDDMDLANYIFLVRNDSNLTKIINASTSKFVLILGRFSEPRKSILESIKNNIRAYQYLPILFDFKKPDGRTLTETIGILAKLSRFIIADITSATFVLHELNHIIPIMVNVPLIPILVKGEYESLTFEHWGKYPWVLPTYEYENEEELLNNIFIEIIEPCEKVLYNLTGIEPPKRLDSENEGIGAPT